MTWKEFKEKIQSLGVEDHHEILRIDVISAEWYPSQGIKARTNEIGNKLVIFN